jgi:hypothetical protein
LNFLWPEEVDELCSPSVRRPFAVAQQAARVKILTRMGLSPAAPLLADSADKDENVQEDKSTL